MRGEAVLGGGLSVVLNAGNISAGHRGDTAVCSGGLSHIQLPVSFSFVKAK